MDIEEFSLMAIGALFGIAIGIYAMMFYMNSFQADAGINNDWKCSGSMTMYVDIPNDGNSAVEGYHCERVAKN